MTKYIEKNDLKDYQKANFMTSGISTGDYYFSKEKGKFLKLCYDIPYEYLEYLRSLNIQDAVNYPIDIYGTTMKKYASAYESSVNSSTFNLSSSYAQLLPLNIKRQIILEFFTQLRALHQHIVFGDIHSVSLFLNHFQASFGAWDTSRRLEEEKIIKSPYYIYNGPEDQNQFTDVAKLLVASLSFYFQENFEFYLEKETGGALCDILKIISTQYPDLKRSFDIILNEYCSYQSSSQFPVSDFLEQLPREVDTEVSLSRKIYDSLYIY